MNRNSKKPLKKVLAKKIALGIDDAGRASIMGHLVIAGYKGKPKSSFIDCKKLNRVLLNQIFEQDVMSLGDIVVVCIGSNLINQTKLSLDKIEQLTTFFILSLLHNSEEMFIDRIGGMRFLNKLDRHQLKLHYDVDMDDKSRYCSAASIAAKYFRERLMDEFMNIAHLSFEERKKFNYGYFPTLEMRKRFKRYLRKRWISYPKEEEK